MLEQNTMVTLSGVTATPSEQGHLNSDKKLFRVNSMMIASSLQLLSRHINVFYAILDDVIPYNILCSFRTFCLVNCCLTKSE